MPDGRKASKWCLVAFDDWLFIRAELKPRPQCFACGIAEVTLPPSLTMPGPLRAVLPGHTYGSAGWKELENLFMMPPTVPVV